MKMLVHVGLIAAGLIIAGNARAGDRCRNATGYPRPIAYVPVYPSDYGRSCAPPVYQVPVRCRPVVLTPSARVPRVRVQPGYWVYESCGGGPTRRLWQPSRAVAIPPAGSVVWISRW